MGSCLFIHSAKVCARIGIPTADRLLDRNRRDNLSVLPAGHLVLLGIVAALVYRPYYT